MPSPWFTIDTYAGPSRQVGELQITPLNEVWQIRLPGWQGGAIWNRPKAVLVNDQHDYEQILPVPDPTRETIWKIAGYTALFALGLGILEYILRRRQTHDG